MFPARASIHTASESALYDADYCLISMQLFGRRCEAVCIISRRLSSQRAAARSHCARLGLLFPARRSAIVAAGSLNWIWDFSIPPSAERDKVKRYILNLNISSSSFYSMVIMSVDWRITFKAVMKQFRTAIVEIKEQDLSNFSQPVHKIWGWIFWETFLYTQNITFFNSGHKNFNQFALF